MSDTYRGLVYYAEALDRFQVLNHRERPGQGSWVAVDCRDSAGLALEEFRGQLYHAVVRWCEFYPLKDSEQHTPARHSQPELEEKPKRRRTYWPRQLAC
jgi:hypothetical protein